MSDLDALYAEIAAAIGAVAPQQPGEITVADYAMRMRLSIATATDHLRRAVKQGVLTERTALLPSGRRGLVFRRKDG